MKTTIKLDQSTLEKLKVLKQVKKAASYEDLISALIHTEMCKAHAFTKDGYAPIGAIVSDAGTHLVIRDIQGDRVLFDDGTYTINGGGATWKLEILAPSADGFEGGRI